MTDTIRHIVVAVAAVAFWATASYAAEGDREDLAGCTLPNGIAAIPTRGTTEARRSGEVFSFLNNKLAPRPILEGKQWTAKDLFAKIVEAKAGDLMYSRVEQGVFLAVSTRIADLGKHYLHEFSAKTLTRPEVPYAKEDGKDTPGLIRGLSKLTGHCFLVETAEGRAAIFRLIASDDQEAHIQWVYQPDGSRTFVIPKGAVLSEKGVAVGANPLGAAQGGLSIAAIDVREYSIAAKVHLENQKKMVELCIALISSKGADRSNRHVAAILLGQLRAVEGAGVLAEHVDDNLAMVSLRITAANSYRCVQALIDISIPGALAAIAQIEADAKSEPPREADLRLWNDRIELRRNLLSLVVLKVYGEKLAKIILEDKIAESVDPKIKEAYKKALEAFPRIRNWLPEAKVMPPATMSAK